MGWTANRELVQVKRSAETLVNNAVRAGGPDKMVSLRKVGV